LVILIATAPITTTLTATERDWVFLGIGVRIYKMELRFSCGDPILAVT